ncbi:MAG: Rieske 2Fe-2S domain-containing protein [Anaerolineae bacterium]|nr:Rieske 2Fe-2S domain-containing protein [Anaerolineae bacterium]
MAEQHTDNKHDDNTHDQTTRRDFLKLAWGAAGLLVLGEGALVAYKFFAPKVVAGEFGGVFTIGLLDDFPPGSVTPVTAGRFYLVRLADGGLLALYRKCTHLGCAVPWDQAEGKFICPCHASAFEPDGDVLNPPAPRPLDRFAITVVDGEINVDTGTAIQRDHANQSDIVYPSAEVSS